MVDFPVLRLIRSNVEQEILHRPLPIGHIPVSDSNVWRFERLPFWKSPRLDVSYCTGVGEDSFFFEVTDEAVAGTWGDEVGQEHPVEENALGADDHGAHEETRLCHFEEGKEVHPLIVGFFEESLNPRSGFSTCAEESGKALTSRCLASFAVGCAGVEACPRPYLGLLPHFRERRTAQAIFVHSSQTSFVCWLAWDHFEQP